MARNKYLDARIEERTAKTAVAQNITETAAKEGRPLTDDERKTFDELTAQMVELDKEIERMVDSDEAVAKFTKLIGARHEASAARDRAYADAQAKGGDDDDEGDREGRAAAHDYGRRFVESDAFKNYQGHGTSQRVEGPGVASPEFRAAITTQTFPKLSTPATITPAEPAERNRFIDLIGREVVGTGAFTYMQWGPVSEAEEVAEGALKPEATMALTDGAGTLVTYAHYKAITRQALEDVPRIQSIVQGRLLKGVRDKLNSVAAQTFATDATVEVVEGTTLLGAIRVAMAEVEDTGYDASVILLNPTDAANIDLEVMSGTVNGPVRVGSVFGLPIVTSKAITAGTAGVGDFNTAMTWFDRNVLAQYITDSHADFFLRNQLVMLAETRGKILVTEAGAVRKARVTTGG